MTNATNISRFVRSLIFPLQGSVEVSSFVVRHVSVNDKQIDVSTFKLNPSEVTEESLSDLTTAIDTAISQDAEGIGGTQRYVIAALDGEKTMLGRLVVRYAAVHSETGDDELSSEPATSKGLLAQNMRHTEAAMRIASAQSLQLHTIQQRMIARQGEVIESSMDKMVEMFQVVEQLISQKHERDMDVKAQEQSFQIKSEGLAQLKNILPHIMKKISGVTPDNLLPPEVTEIRNIVSGLTEEKIAALEKIFSPDEMLAIASFGQKLAKDETPPNGTTDPH